jgi:hypothetical protein
LSDLKIKIMSITEVIIEQATADPSLKRVRLILSSLSNLDLGKFVSELRNENSRLDVVSKPNFIEWMCCKGYWLGHDKYWYAQRDRILTTDEFLELKKEHHNL